ncbi:MAG: DUF4231 domain-containing protein [Chitinophagaceae bacterium]|nr:DUF4231 domain-containing protein [Chitinophagaceae bacterium]
MNIQNYLNDRVENQVHYYESKSALNKQYYLFFKIAQLTAATLLPFFSVFLSDYSWMKYVIAFLGSVVTILEGVMATGKYYEKWVIYRSTAETLRQEKYLFLMQAGSYSGQDAVQQFVNKIEFSLGKENVGWQQLIVKDNKSGNNQPGNERNINEQTDKPAPAETSINTPAETTPSAPLDPITGVQNDAEALKDT